MIDEIMKLLQEKIITSATGINKLSNAGADKCESESVLNLVQAYKLLGGENDVKMMRDEIAMLKIRLDNAYKRIAEYESKYEGVAKERKNEQRTD